MPEFIEGQKADKSVYIATTIGPRTGKTVENQRNGWELVLREPCSVAYFLSDVASSTEPLILTAEQRAPTTYRR